MRLPVETKAKLNKEILSGLIGLVGEWVDPGIVLSGSILNDVQSVPIQNNIKLSKEDIRLTWES